MANFERAVADRNPEDYLFWGVSLRLGTGAPTRITNADRDVEFDATALGADDAGTYQEIPFTLRPVDDVEGQEPEVVLQVTNVGVELISWLDANNWGAGASARIFQYALDDAGGVDIGIDRTLIISDVGADEDVVTARFGYRNMLNRPAGKVTFDAGIAPGLV